MNTKPTSPSSPAPPSEAAIREKAHELYVRSGWIHGRDRKNRLEAKAILMANPPGQSSNPPARPTSEARTHHASARARG
jgi:hypothetical protein